VTGGVPVEAQVARAARLLAAAGLVEGFGHVSSRAGDGFVITSTRPLGAMEPHDVGPPGARDRPIETPLHAALYRARPDIGAICRTHSPAAVAWGARGAAPPVVHGLGGLSGEIALGDEADLVADEAAAEAAARALGRADVLLPRGNGAVCTGADLPAACTRAWFLEERARVALAAGPSAPPLRGAALSARSRHHPTETARAWQWLAWRFRQATDPTDQLEGDPP
jgi:ribulose-5-phosphate 4-epimerase/fuculose-1-phosphate aldolase